MTAIGITPHPISLLHLSFPKTAFERRTVQMKDGDLLLFPRFDLEARRTLDLERRRIALQLNVKSRPATKAVVKFNFDVQAVFECMEHVQSQEALAAFAPAPAMLQIAWPYVRPYMAEQMTMLGLPPYHLPLVIEWHIHDPEGDHLPRASAQVAESRQGQTEQE